MNLCGREQDPQVPTKRAVLRQRLKLEPQLFRFL